MNYVTVDDFCKKLTLKGDLNDALRNAGIVPTSVVLEQNPLCMRDTIKIEGYIAPKVGEGKLPADTIKRSNMPFEAKKILKNGDYMTVLWADGTKTIVKRAADEPQSDYAAFTAALGIKAYGSNSALKRIVAGAEEQGKKKKKKPATNAGKQQNEGEILRALEEIKEGNRAAYKHDNRS